VRPGYGLSCSPSFKYGACIAVGILRQTPRVQNTRGYSSSHPVRAKPSCYYLTLSGSAQLPPCFRRGLLLVSDSSIRPLEFPVWLLLSL
jgi:hypothetical protein